MTQFNFSLRSIFEACRKVVNPTPEEKAERILNNKISDLTSKLDMAVRGVKLVPFTKDEIMTIGARSASAFTVLHLPHSYEPLEGEERTARIQNISDKLAALGVEESAIQKMIAKTEEEMRNPRDHDYPPSF